MYTTARDRQKIDTIKRKVEVAIINIENYRNDVVNLSDQLQASIEELKRVIEWGDEKVSRKGSVGNAR